MNLDLLMVAAILGQYSCSLASALRSSFWDGMSFAGFETHIFRKKSKVNIKPAVKNTVVNVGQLRYILVRGTWHKRQEMMAAHVHRKAVMQSWSIQAAIW